MTLVQGLFKVNMNFQLSKFKPTMFTLISLKNVYFASINNYSGLDIIQPYDYIANSKQKTIGRHDIDHTVCIPYWWAWFLLQKSVWHETEFNVEPIWVWSIFLTIYPKSTLTRIGWLVSYVLRPTTHIRVT